MAKKISTPLLSEQDLIDLVRKIKDCANKTGANVTRLMDDVVEPVYYDTVSHGIFYDKSTYGWKQNIQSLNHRHWLKAETAR